MFHKFIYLLQKYTKKPKAQNFRLRKMRTRAYIVAKQKNIPLIPLISHYLQTVQVWDKRDKRDNFRV
jgi:hypothetical protein